MSSDIGLTLNDHVASVEIHRPPNNFFDFDLIREIADTYERLDDDPDCRAIVLCSEGKHFCAGANFQSRESWGNDQLDRQAGQHEPMLSFFDNPKHRHISHAGHPLDCQQPT